MTNGFHGLFTDPALWLGPTGGLVIALTGCWLFLRRFECLQDQMFTFFRQELRDCQVRYSALVAHLMTLHDTEPPSPN